MSKWAGKYIIGLTGNIGTGKSVVRRMLEHLGAYGIDADALGHRAIARGAPGYQPLLQYFGNWVVGPDGEINRAKLGRIVFSDPEALKVLESITHPLVSQALDIIIQRSSQKVVVVEAIKLLEAHMGELCDSIWVVTAPADIQQVRLVTNRKLAPEDAVTRIQSQPAQEEKAALANVLIRNTGSFEETWKQVVTAWQKVVPSPSVGGADKPAAAADAITQPVRIPEGEMTVIRGTPRNSALIAAVINRLKKPEVPLKPEDIMAAFGEKAFLIIQVGDIPVGVIGWKVENLVSRTNEIYLDPMVPQSEALPQLIKDMETASRELQCEASLVFAPMELSQNDSVWSKMGYERRSPQTLGVMAWQEAALENKASNTVLYFKQLRQDRILRPI